MKNRYRVEIYDENKANDLTIYSEQGVDKEYLTELCLVLALVIKSLCLG